MEILQGLEDFIREKVENGRWTHAKISAHLQQAYPGERGFSFRSLERFCRAKGIHKTARLSEQELDEAVAGAIAKVMMMFSFVNRQWLESQQANGQVSGFGYVRIRLRGAVISYRWV